METVTWLKIKHAVVRTLVRAALAHQLHRKRDTVAVETIACARIARARQAADALTDRVSSGGLSVLDEAT